MISPDNVKLNNYFINAKEALTSLVVYGTAIVIGIPLGLTASGLTFLAAIPLNLTYQPILFIKKRIIDKDIKYLQENQTEKMKKIVNDFFPNNPVSNIEFANQWDKKTPEERCLLVRALTISFLLEASKRKKNNISERMNFTVQLLKPVYNLLVIFNEIFDNGTDYYDDYDPLKKERDRLKNLLEKGNSRIEDTLYYTDFVQKLTKYSNKEIPDLGRDRSWIFPK